MIAINGISLQFGGKALFQQASLQIGARDRIGLVGSNGAGKSTMLRILLGEQLPDEGEVAKANFVTVGYLPQEGMWASGTTLYREVESVFDDIVRIQTDLDAVHRRMESTDPTSEEFQELLTLFGELQHRLEDTDAFRMKSNIEKVLMGLGFTTRDFDRSTEEFSGGWQMRIALAKLLLQQPSLLLLDEPTNHLDLDSLEWLETYLAGYDGAVMIVSHDSRFLDTMTTRTCELSLGSLTEYAGNYSYYLRARAERRAQQQAAFENQQKKIKQTERFIERFRAKATKARQVQSRVKALEKLELIELEDEELEIRFAFPPAPAGGRSVIELKHISKSYDGETLFRDLMFDIDRGDRIAFVGVNGAGKSTLSRIIAGVEKADGGSRLVGHNVSVSYFAQHQAEELDPGKTVLETLDEVATGDTRRRLRTLLGSFLFSGDDVFKSVKVLSGGEKSRLALAKMLLQPSNLIILDEPTNHLDMRSKAVLAEALLDFEGSCVIVSHDRDFLDPLVNKVVEFSGGTIREFPGNVSEYLERRERDREEAKGKRPAPAPGTSPKQRKREEAEQRQRLYKLVAPLRAKLKRLEQEIENKEERKAEIEKAMAAPSFYGDPDLVKQMTAEYAAVGEELNRAYHRWNDLTRELEEAENQHREGDQA
ncbi:MAG: ABC-F family ATP-binding cassette domain-containing protein [Ignavibacteria bacterium]|nr:ABC-F family ATP-binding cassette domain-containing protein [Ignavibacteria bacterium]